MGNRPIHVGMWVSICGWAWAYRWQEDMDGYGQVVGQGNMDGHNDIDGHKHMSGHGHMDGHQDMDSCGRMGGHGHMDRLWAYG